MSTEIKKADTRKSSSLLKKMLKEKYGITCSVRSEFYSGGCSLNVSYKLGPEQKEIESLLNNLQYGAFDGMTDCSYIVDVDGIIYDGYKLAEFKHVFVKQEWSEEFNLLLCQCMMKDIKFGELVAPATLKEFYEYRNDIREYDGHSGTFSNLLYTRFKVSHWATQDEGRIKLLECHFNPETCSEIYFIYEVDGVKYNTSILNEPVKAETAKPAPVEVPADEVQIIEYSEKAIAVIGNTYPIRETLRSVGGKFNKFLSCGPGWIFGRTKLTDLQTALNVAANV